MKLKTTIAAIMMLFLVLTSAVGATHNTLIISAADDTIVSDALFNLSQKQKETEDYDILFINTKGGSPFGEAILTNGGRPGDETYEKVSSFKNFEEMLRQYKNVVIDAKSVYELGTLSGKSSEDPTDFSWITEMFTGKQFLFVYALDDGDYMVESLIGNITGKFYCPEVDEVLRKF